jgi:hypothetical protein
MLYKLVVKLWRQYSVTQESFDHHTVTSSDETAMLTKVTMLLLKEHRLIRVVVGRDLKPRPVLLSNNII